MSAEIPPIPGNLVEAGRIVGSSEAAQFHRQSLIVVDHDHSIALGIKIHIFKGVAGAGRLVLRS